MDDDLFGGRSDSEEDRQQEEPPKPKRGGRDTCWEGCGRPRTTCICHLLPPHPIPTTTQVLILHHPHELRQKLSTVPALTKSLLHCHTVPGRRLRLGSSPLLDSLYHNPTNTSTLFLFPTLDRSAPAADLRELKGSRDAFLLVVFDGTWKHAREMVSASLPFLGRFARQVFVGSGVDVGVEGESMYESGLVMRKEPFKGCMSTMEAVARALGILEAPEVEERLLGVLRGMVGLQRCHLKAVKPRVRLKKLKEKKDVLVEDEEEGEEHL